MENGERFENVRLLRTARGLNNGMIDYWTEKIVMESLKVNKPLKDVKICVKGITYRQGVKEFYHSRNLALAKKLLEKGLNAYAWDEPMPKEEVEEKTLHWIDPREADLCSTASLSGREPIMPCIVKERSIFFQIF